jgi:hypothetical protein
MGNGRGFERWRDGGMEGWRDGEAKGSSLTTHNPELGTRNLEPGTWNPELGTRNIHQSLKLKN